MDFLGVPPLECDKVINVLGVEQESQWFTLAIWDQKAIVHEFTVQTICYTGTVIFQGSDNGSFPWGHERDYSPNLGCTTVFDRDVTGTSPFLGFATVVRLSKGYRFRQSWTSSNVPVKGLVPVKRYKILNQAIRLVSYNKWWKSHNKGVLEGTSSAR